MRSSGGTNFGLALSVVARTNSTIAVLAAPSFQDGSGSFRGIVCAAKARLAVMTIAKANRIRTRGFIVRTACLRYRIFRAKSELCSGGRAEPSAIAPVLRGPPLQSYER